MRYLVFTTCAAAIYAVLLDAKYTVDRLNEGRTEGNRLRAILVRNLGPFFGSYGVAALLGLYVLLVNILSKQTDLSLVIGNTIFAALFFYAAVHNKRLK